MNKKVVIIGGGTGTYAVTEALCLIPNLTITKIVSVFDSGGSTGRLKDEFGFLPVGDIRQSLAAATTGKHQKWVRKLLLYRFKKGQSLVGHNLGNLIITALQDISGSTTKALELASHIFQTKASVIPVTNRVVELQIKYSDGTVKVGEHFLDDCSLGGQKIYSIDLTQPCRLHKDARSAIKQADIIIVGPGDLYGSIIPNFLVSDMPQTYKNSPATKIFILNLMTRYTQTHGMTAKDHIKTVETYSGCEFDNYLVNSTPIPPAIQTLYQNQNEFPVEVDLKKSPKTITADLISTKIVKKNKSDKSPRSLLRHDAHKLSTSLTKLIQKL